MSQRHSEYARMPGDTYVRTSDQGLAMRPEDQIHRAVADHLRLRAPNLVWWHTPNQGNLPVQYRVKLKRMGVMPGVADLCFLKDGTFFALELKAEKGRVSEHQENFCKAIQDAGGYAAIGYGLDRSLKILEAWELLKGA